MRKIHPQLKSFTNDRETSINFIMEMGEILFRLNLINRLAWLWCIISAHIFKDEIAKWQARYLRSNRRSGRKIISFNGYVNGKWMAIIRSWVEANRIESNRKAPPLQHKWDQQKDINQNETHQIQTGKLTLLEIRISFMDDTMCTYDLAVVCHINWFIRNCVAN